MKLFIPASLCLWLFWADVVWAQAYDDSLALKILQGVCDNAEPTALGSAAGTILDAHSEVVFRGQTVGWRATLTNTTGDRFDVQRLAPGDRLRGARVEWWKNQKPHLAFSADAQCDVQIARRMVYGKDGRLNAIAHLDSWLNDIGQRDLVNPPVPHTTSKDGVKVALIDAGVNYTIPFINRRLARDDAGMILGYDFWDLDDRPFDSNPARSIFFPQRHGTRTASLLLREAPQATLVPYRYPRLDMSRMSELLRAVEKVDIMIVGMPLGSKKPTDWEVFATAARAMTNTLFIVSAGNHGLNIDATPSYPAVLELENMIVVTSADDSGHPAQGSNWGPKSVDILVPAERLETLSFNGEDIKVSGSSYAVSRVAALAARLLAKQPGLKSTDLKQEIYKRVVRKGFDRFVRLGYLPDPLAASSDVAVIEQKSIGVDSKTHKQEGQNVDLALSVVLLQDSGWSETDIPILMRELNSILAQCTIRLSNVMLHKIRVVDRLIDFNSANAHTLVSQGPMPKPTVYLVRDTLREPAFDGEAFGQANTRHQSWLQDTVWLTSNISDPEIGLAHELFHVLSNSGEHVDDDHNLMSRRTTKGGTALTQSQCEGARKFGLTHGLLQVPR